VTLYWLGFNVLGGLLPTWGSALLLRLRGQQLVYADFAKHGEFALYSAAFLAPALLVIFRYAKRNRYVLGAGSGLMAVSGLLVSALVYATAASAAVNPGGHPVDESYLVAFSTGLLVFSLVVALLVAFVENQATNLNLQEVESRQQEELRTKFEKKLGGGDGGN
jgi:hypothetical protein